jgi:hypothetical protein
VFVGECHKLTHEGGITVDRSKLRGHEGGERTKQGGVQADKNWSVVRRIKVVVVVETGTVDMGQKIGREEYVIKTV